MRLQLASHKAVKFACMNFHYAKRIPAGLNVSYSVFNDEGEWCGVIVYGYPASPSLVTQFNLRNGEVLELRRVALNSKQKITSRALGISMRLIKKDCPSVKMLVSYSDLGQNHYGTIYQATNWLFLDETKSSGTEYFCNGKWVHGRHGKGDIKRKLPGKRKYVYPLDKELLKEYKLKQKPYPKKLSEVVGPNAISQQEC
jgi:hypothetical protein